MKLAMIENQCSMLVVYTVIAMIHNYVTYHDEVTIMVQYTYICEYNVCRCFTVLTLQEYCKCLIHSTLVCPFV